VDNSQEGCLICSVSEWEMIFELDPAIYRLSAIKKAAYKFADRFHIQLLTSDSGWIKALLKSKAAVENSKAMAGDFCNEVLDQELREVVAEDTRLIRDLLLRQAFSATSLIDAFGDDSDYHTDPKCILRSALSSPIRVDNTAR